MKTVREMLLKKGNKIHSISPNQKIFEALQLMAKEDVGALLVLDGESLVGILSERDYARKVALEGKSSKDCLVSDIMSSKVMYVENDSSTGECMALMINKKVRHLPVFDKGKLIGVISIGDVVNAVIDEKEFEIDQLVRYITDSRG
ncbi:MAG: CBS domain-containing protein [Ignavibacteriales bacterium]|jgi:CBS domain-containing protein|nr:CBS domain-containing protein [Ignavibacteriales bacterium]